MRNAVIAATLLSALASGARADDAYLSPTQDRVRLSLGISQTNASTSFELDASDGTPGSVIDGENTLGLDPKQTVPEFEVEVRAGARHRLRINYSALDRDDTRPLTTPLLQYGGSTLLLGDPVETNLSIRAFGLTYGYSFVHNDRLELAATLGVSDVDINSRVTVATATRHVDIIHSFAGPFPIPGLEATWVISKRFYMDAHAQYLKASINKLSASTNQWELHALYRLRPNISLALGYSSLTSDLISRKPGSMGFADFTARGPQLFVRVSF
jgi:hypothetical protein